MKAVSQEEALTCESRCLTEEKIPRSPAPTAAIQPSFCSDLVASRSPVWGQRPPKHPTRTRRWFLVRKVGGGAQVFGVTTDPFILWTSNMWALLSLRSLYAFVAVAMGRLVYLDKSIALVLAWVSFKLVGHLPSCAATAGTIHSFFWFPKGTDLLPLKLKESKSGGVTRGPLSSGKDKGDRGTACGRSCAYRRSTVRMGVHWTPHICYRVCTAS